MVFAELENSIKMMKTFTMLLLFFFFLKKLFTSSSIVKPMVFWIGRFINCVKCHDGKENKTKEKICMSRFFYEKQELIYVFGNTHILILIEVKHPRNLNHT